MTQERAEKFKQELTEAIDGMTEKTGDPPRYQLTGELIPEEIDPLDKIYDETPLFKIHNYRGMPGTEMMLRLGFITEDDLEDPPQEQGK